MATILKAKSFKPSLQTLYNIMVEGEKAGITDAAVIRQCVEHGLQDIQNGTFTLKPEEFTRSYGRKVSRRMKEELEKKRHITNLETGKNAASESPKGP